jgi:hypothetical protein
MDIFAWAAAQQIYQRVGILSGGLDTGNHVVYRANASKWIGMRSRISVFETSGKGLLIDNGNSSH